MPDIREVHVEITTRSDGRAYARSEDAPGLLLSADDAETLMSGIAQAIEQLFERHTNVTLQRTTHPTPTIQWQIYEVELEDDAAA
jgi:hypothetical protein